MPERDDLRLNVAGIARGSRVNGPGLRAVVWVQGCTIGCAGCFNPQTHPHAARQLLESAALARELCALPSLDGVTLSGGEPFEQAAACARFAEEVGAHGLSLMVFTGYPYKLLAGSPFPEVQRLLQAIDLLVAGPYIAARAIAPRDFRASSNQELRVLSARGELALQQRPSDGPCIEVAADGRGLSWSGFPAPSDQVWLQSAALVKPRL